MRKDFRQIKSFQITNRLQRRIEASIADAAPVVVHCPISVSAADTGHSRSGCLGAPPRQHNFSRVGNESFDRDGLHRGCLQRSLARDRSAQNLCNGPLKRVRLHRGVGEIAGPAHGAIVARLELLRPFLPPILSANVERMLAIQGKASGGGTGRLTRPFGRPYAILDQDQYLPRYRRYASDRLPGPEGIYAWFIDPFSSISISTGRSSR
jgi:hypothetical protein